MYFLRAILFLPLIFMLSGCAKFGYVIEQGMEQLRIQNRAIANEQVLKSPKYSKQHKEKIKKIMKYREYFQEFFGKKVGEIYSKTTFLKRDAVSYLVITSPFHKIEALKECFPFVGCFPYIGFFNMDSALEYMQDQEQEEKVTYMRKVYAYSTLGYFTDTILSSFFHYNDYALAELIFHELFHTIFFVKDNVSLNENLANFFGKELAKIYFKKSNISQVGRGEKNRIKQKEIHKEVVRLVGVLQARYKAIKGTKKEVFENELSQFLKSTFYPEVEKKCTQLGVARGNCSFLHRKWNNASFSAFLTYEDKMNEIERFVRSEKMELLSFYRFLEKQLTIYKQGDRDVPFSNFLLARLKQ